MAHRGPEHTTNSWRLRHRPRRRSCGSEVIEPTNQRSRVHSLLRSGPDCAEHRCGLPRNLNGLPVNDGAVLCRQRVKRGVYLLVRSVPISELQRGGFNSITLDPPTPTEVAICNFCHDFWKDIHLRGPVFQVNQAVSIQVVFTQIIEGTPTSVLPLDRCGGVAARVIALLPNSCKSHKALSRRPPSVYCCGSTAFICVVQRSN